MKSKITKTLLSLAFATGLLAVSGVADAYWYHGYYYRDGYYRPYYHGYYRPYYYGYKCRWVGGFWSGGYWHPARRVCWYR